uniref:Uncharacterized protein n=1 Tax=Arundo donax TaxID=35708 RepID=A0A0A9SAK3_ARUDO
MVRNTIAVKKA